MRTTLARKLALGALMAGLASGCAAGQNRHELYRALSEPSREAYDRYRQFMTERQQESYLAAKTDEERQRLVADLHVEERLARYPDYIQQAIWSQQVVAGMDREAVLLTWGKPDRVERPELDSEQRVSSELWVFESTGEARTVEIVQGVVTEVERSE